jgi:FkbM family methyltransferase
LFNEYKNRIHLIDAFFRKLPVFRGKERLARTLFKNSLGKRKDILIKGKLGCEYILPNIVENIGFEIFTNGIYEQVTSDFIVSRLPPNGVFLDLGANIGAITIPLKARRKDIKVVCVEAAPWIYSYLEQNLKKNQVTNVHAFNRALYYSDHEILNFYSPEEKFGKGSLSPVFTNSIIPVTTIKVDTLVTELGISKVDLIKIDVEGYEYHVFRGAAALLGRDDAPDIIFEFVDWAEEAAEGATAGDAQKILVEMGYRIFYFSENGIGQEVQGILGKGFFMLFATKRNVH